MSTQQVAEEEVAAEAAEQRQAVHEMESAALLLANSTLYRYQYLANQHSNVRISRSELTRHIDMARLTCSRSRSAARSALFLILVIVIVFVIVFVVVIIVIIVISTSWPSSRRSLLRLLLRHSSNGFTDLVVCQA
jgi:hypothetical protein